MHPKAVELEEHRKLDIAVSQLETAIRLYRESQFIQSATLAAAAEEILGRYVEIMGCTSSYRSQTDAVSAVHRLLFNEDISLKQAASAVNLAKNSLKHMNGIGDSTLLIDFEAEAKDLIWRAVENYDLLELPSNEVIDGFPNVGPDA